MKKTVTVFLPAYNEESGLGETIQDIKNVHLPGYDVELLVVDNNSVDATHSIARKNGAKVYFEWQQGKGHAVRKGFYIANSEYVIMLDADYTYPAIHIPQFLEKLQHNDVVMGSRFLGRRESGSIEFSHMAGNKMLTLFAQILYGKSVTDLCTGYWGFTKDALQKITVTANGFDVEANLFAECVRNKLSVCEIPIGYRNREGDAKLSTITDGYKIAKALINHRFVNTSSPALLHTSLQETSRTAAIKE